MKGQRTARIRSGVTKFHIVLWVILIAAQASMASKFDSGRSSLNVKCGDRQLEYVIESIFVLPSEEITVELMDKVTPGKYSAVSSFGELGQVTPYRWKRKAPAVPGLYSITLKRLQSVDSMQINVFVVVPYDSVKSGYIKGYRIGNYPTTLFKGLQIYKPPRGFIEVTPELLDLNLSPHFKLKQFLCKQVSEFPKFVVLRRLLLHKLEMILEKTNEAGYSCSSFAILSGYRTPYYNKSIGNVKYSRHQWGGAADIYIDENPKDGMMDDLNEDGSINWKDAAVLYTLIDDLADKGSFSRFIGGLARYKNTSNHGPFVHVDVRGHRARWGD